MLCRARPLQRVSLPLPRGGRRRVFPLPVAGMLGGLVVRDWRIRPRRGGAELLVAQRMSNWWRKLRLVHHKGRRLERARAVHRLMKNASLYDTLEEVASDRGLNLNVQMAKFLIDSLTSQSVTAHTKQKIVQDILTMRGKKTGEYENVLPQRIEAVVSRKVPEELEGIPMDKVEWMLDLPKEQFDALMEAAQAQDLGLDTLPAPETEGVEDAEVVGGDSNA